VQEGEDEDLANPHRCYDIPLDEVTLPQSLRMGFEELAPVALGGIELRIEPVFPEDVDHGAARHLQPELAELTDDPRVTPVVLLR